MLRQINQEESILMSVATNGSAGVTVFVRVSDNRYARVPAGAAERDRLTWDSYYPAAPFFGLFSQFHDYNRNVISLRHHSANGKVSLLRSNELIYPKLSGPFVEFHKAIFWVGGWDPYSHPRFSNLFRPSYKLSPRAGKETVADVAAVWSHAAEHSHVPAFVRPFVTGRSFRLSPRGSWGQFVRPVGL